MQQSFKLAAALFVTAVLAGCGGSQGGDQSLKIKFSSQVSFGDSLSDVGTYAVGTVAALKGGKYNVNDVGADGSNAAKNWTELMAAQLGLAAPCPAQTGLDGSAAQGFSVPVVNHAGCTSYAQGGARVTNPVGPGNKLLGGENAVIGQLTVPIVTQIQNHLAASGGSFKGDEIVFVMAGGNDALMQLNTLQAGATTPTAAVTAMGVAGAELVGYVKNLIVGKGAKYVTVVNLPDLSTTPYALSKDAATRQLINTLVTTFNAQLQSGLSDNPNVLLIDSYTVTVDQAVNPGPYGLTNVTTPACDLTHAKNPLGSALGCTKSNLVAGADEHYEFADGVHPTPYAYWLLARFVSKGMVARGWL